MPVLDPLFAAANRLSLEHQPISRIVFGRWGGPRGEEVVVCRLGAQELELHCHGGAAAVQQIEDDLSSLGFEIETWQSRARRRGGLAQAELLHALSQARTARTAALLHAQWSGVFIECLRGLSAELTALASLTVSVATVDRAAVPTDWDQRCAAALSRVDEWLTWREFARHLIAPWRVALAGPANVGKSSLINAWLGYDRSIVHSEPGTTRDVVTGEAALEGWPVLLTDTAGLRSSAGGVEAMGIERGIESWRQADCRILVLDASQPLPDGAEPMERSAAHLVIANKCDLPDLQPDPLRVSDLRVSALTGMGLAELTRAVVQKLVPRLPPDDVALPVTEALHAVLLASREALAAGDPTAALSRLMSLA